MAKRTTKTSRDKHEVVIPAMKRGIVEVLVGGDTPLLQHQFSGKAARQMEWDQCNPDPTSKRGRRNKEPRDPVREFVEAIHLIDETDREVLYKRLVKMKNPDGVYKGPAAAADVTKAFKGIRVGFPASGFKEACRRGVKDTGMSMTDFAANVWINGTDGTYLVEIKFKKVNFRRDHVRIGGMSKSTDLRYRPEFIGWSAALDISFDSEKVTVQDVHNAVERGGAKCGVGEWRPNSTKPGEFGRFRVKATTSTKRRKAA